LWLKEAQECLLDIQEPMRFILMCNKAHFSSCKNHWGSFLCYAQLLCSLMSSRFGWASVYVRWSMFICEQKPKACSSYKAIKFLQKIWTKLLNSCGFILRSLYKLFEMLNW